MKKVLISLLSIGAVAVVAVFATQAFFSDTETSTGNLLQAGAIDLTIDNESYVTNPLTGNLVASPNTSWTLRDLTIEKFFNFTDLKPGDVGEDTISVHVNSNDAWLCAAARITADEDVDCTEPELSDDLTCTNPGVGQGELDSSVNFAFWKDDGDNVLEVGETPFLSGPISSLGGSGQIALADSSTNAVFGQNTPIPGNTTVYIAKAWCFGTMTPAPLAQNAGTGPTIRGTGFTCNGASVNNAAQTDKVVADLQFYAVQSRNNSSFTCAQNYTPVWPEVVQRPTVGALLSAYVQPTGATCNINVDSALAESVNTSATINGGIALATPGQTVCVDDGTYTEDVNVNKSITLSGDGATATSTINGVGTGEAGALVISANDVVVEGFNVIGTGVSAIRISGARNNVTIRYNKAVAASGQNALLMNGGQTNHTASNNIFEGASSQLVYVNGLASVSMASTNVDFLNNTFRGTGNLALGQEAGASDIKWNKFSTVTSFTDVEDWEGGNLYNQNNFNDAGLNLQHSENGATGDNGITNAENNWWGDGNPSDGDVNLNVDVDFTPFEGSAFPEN